MEGKRDWVVLRLFWGLEMLFRQSFLIVLRSEGKLQWAVSAVESARSILCAINICSFLFSSNFG